MTRFFSLLFLLIATSASAQCDLELLLEFDPCDHGTITQTFTTDCVVDEISITYFEYGVNGSVESTNFIYDSFDDIPPVWDMDPSLGINLHVEVEVSFEGEVIATVEVEEFIPEDINYALGPDWLVPSCDGGCFAFSPDHGYWWDYQITIDGVVYENGLYEPFCFSSVGVHTLELVNANGCLVEEEIEVNSLGVDENPICEQALTLTNGELLSDETCSDLLGMSECDTWSALAANWYVINSEMYEFMEVGVAIDSIFIYTIEVYADLSGTGCDGLESVACLPGSEIPGCYDFAAEFTLEPNTDYYVLFRTSQGHNFEIGAQLYNSDAPQTLCGCADPDNCLYDPLAQITVECGYEGCTDANACNYSNWAQCDDGSCTFGENLTVQLFNDANGNGTWDLGWFNEPALGNTGSVTIEELGLTIFPNSSGAFELPEGLPLDTYTVSYSDDNGVWEFPGGTQEVTLPSCNGYNVGLVSTSNTLLQVSGPCCIWMMNLHCEFGMNPGLWVENTGTVPLNGTFTMTFDDILIPEYLAGATAYDSYTPGVLVWNIEMQNPGESVLYQCHIQGPGEAYLGTVFPFDMDLNLVDDGGLTVYDQSWTLEPEVVCAYDPNDKYTVPEGYTENHFILEDDQLEYRVRFQNTGNFPAATVRIEDQLDLEHLDIDTFEPVFASHDFTTELGDDGLVNFIFNDIQLPGMEDDEPGSQGYVVYRISPRADVEPWDVIENTASIFFDGNEPIITNTTSHAIFDCDWLWGLPEYDNFCEGDYSTLPMNQDFVEDYIWTVDGEPVGDNAGQIELNFDEAGDYELGLTISNPLCTNSSVMNLGVHPFPDADVLVDGNTFTAAEADWYAWYLNGELIDDATDQTYTATEDGDYHVELGTDWGCTTVSEIMVVGLETLNQTSVVLYPNPTSGLVRMDGLDHPVAAQVMDASGRVVMEVTLNPSTMLDLSGLAEGMYAVQFVIDGAMHRLPVVLK